MLSSTAYLNFISFCSLHRILISPMVRFVYSDKLFHKRIHIIHRNKNTNGVLSLLFLSDKFFS